MEKTVFVLRRPDGEVTDAWCEQLRTTVAQRLLTAGAAGLTAHVRDGAVAAAMMRLTTLRPPVAAVMTMWVEQSYGPAIDEAVGILGADGVVVHGYLVTESVPMRLPATPAGERTDGFANIALLRRPADLATELWRERWQGQYTKVAIDTQATIGYTQNLVVRALTSDAPAVAAIVEEQFPDAALTDAMAWYGADGPDDLADRLRRMVESVASFGADRDLDTVPTSRYDLRSPFVFR